MSFTLTAADLSAMAADVAAIIAEWPQSIAIRRRDETLPAQTVRIARTGGRGNQSDSDAAAQAQAPITVIGTADLDIATGDRFTVDGQLYRVLGVHPDNRAFTQAAAELVQ